MRLASVRFTVRRLMGAVAVVAVAMLVLVKPFWGRARWSRISAYHAGVVLRWPGIHIHDFYLRVESPR